MNRKRIVIVGAGFAGVYLAKYLKRLSRNIDVTLVSERNYFLFSPLLHEVATGGLDPLSISEPLAELFRDTCVSVVHASVQNIDVEKKNVETTLGSLTYDQLVIASGSRTNFYGIPGAEGFALPLKDLSDAMNLRRAVIDRFERATFSRIKEDRKRLLSFVVVGGGATGVELAGELAEFGYDTMLRYFPRISRDDISITLVHKGKELLPQFSPYLRKRALRDLCNVGVSVCLETTVRSVAKNRVVLHDGTDILTETVVWVAGVIPVLPSVLPPLVLNERGQIVVDSMFSAPRFADVYALGDVAEIRGEDGLPTPLFAQAAIKEAKALAHILLGKKGAFTYRSLGTLVSLGRWQAVGDPLGVPISGFLAWWIWRTTYLFKFMSWKKRFRIALGWTINFFAPRDISVL